MRFCHISMSQKKFRCWGFNCNLFVTSLKVCESKMFSVVNRDLDALKGKNTSFHTIFILILSAFVLELIAESVKTEP